ncbi:hypothetical protein [Mucisphaera calidilacus]|uniref:Uncharacterized protein n=1 Tax=Mucisphaera calidilacus TaxID=2527982 RepID=A0A518BV72_9BACT|nr:hypothetical protein [Mucisphaera calidilacus]QDU70866.1 hypothetical protein Pan265_07070 [Mucisphaera calidilacus]
MRRIWHRAAHARDGSTGQHELSLWVQHLDRCWKAAETDAQRLQAQLQVRMAGLLALLGLGFIEISPFYTTRTLLLMPPWLAVLVYLLLATALLYLGRSLSTLFRNNITNRPQQSGSSCELLLPDQKDFDAPPYEAVWVRLSEATADLTLRNHLLGLKIKKANKLLAMTVLIVVLAIAGELWGIMTIVPTGRLEHHVTYSQIQNKEQGRRQPLNAVESDSYQKPHAQHGPDQPRDAPENSGAAPQADSLGQDPQ